MHRCLLVTGHDITEIGILHKGLADAGYIAMSEYSEATGKELVQAAIVLHILILQKFNDSLTCG
jgi:hypothetical protein